MVANEVAVIAEKRFTALFAEPDGLVLEKVELKVLHQIPVPKFVSPLHLVRNAKIDYIGIPCVLSLMVALMNESEILESISGAMNDILSDVLRETSRDSN